jgi:hypothetical protein
MNLVLDLPVPVFVGRPVEAPVVPPGEEPVSRSHPDAATVVWCAGGGVDAEWDRPPPRVSLRLVFAPEERVERSAGKTGAPFWVHWTAKEAMYKLFWRAARFVPAEYPLADLREEPPPGDPVLRFFTWNGGFTACVRVPGGEGRRLWISVARTPAAPEMRNVT